LLHVSSRVQRTRTGALRKRRVQLAGGILLAIGVPLLLRLSFPPAPSAELIKIWVSATLGAILLGFYSVRSLSVFPGITVAAWVLPCFGMSYVAVLVVCGVLRLDYSRFLFSTSFLISCVWFFCSFFLARERTMRIGVVPGGEVEGLYGIDRIVWVPLLRPDAMPISSYDAIVADLRADLPDQWERFLADSALTGVPVYHVKQLRESLIGRVEIDHLSENNFGSLVPGRLYVQAKQVLDSALALVTLAIMLLPFALVAIAIRMDSRGPVFFCQERIGRGGKPFKVIKFRTMHPRQLVRAEDELRDAITLTNDSRITRVGALLRRTRIDELPQIINILRGEMSWIGPRPEAKVLSEWYERELPFYRYRHIVRPGITGWAQVNQGHVAEISDVHWKLHYDFYYIKNVSPWIDILIIFKTIQIVVTGFGSK